MPASALGDRAASRSVWRALLRVCGFVEERTFVETASELFAYGRPVSNSWGSYPSGALRVAAMAVTSQSCDIPRVRRVGRTSIP